jgi:sec-independent protein translocase protein TatA
MAGITSPFHLIILLIVVVLLFGAGKIPRLAEDMAKGIKAFRHGMREDEKPEEKRDLPPVDKPPTP